MRRRRVSSIGRSAVPVSCTTISSLSAHQWNANRKSIGYTESSRLLTDLKKREETAWLSE